MNEQDISKAIEKVVGEIISGKTEIPHKCTCNNKMTLDLALKLINEVEAQAVKQNMKVVVAVCNAYGNPVAVHCMDDSYLASYEVAINKAYTSVSLKMPTSDLAKLANPNGGNLYGIQFTNNGRIIIFGGGEPLENNGKIIGGVGVSGGTAEEDTALGEFAKNKFKEIISWR